LPLREYRTGADKSREKTLGPACLSRLNSACYAGQGMPGRKSAIHIYQADRSAICSNAAVKWQWSIACAGVGWGLVCGSMCSLSSVCNSRMPSPSYEVLVRCFPKMAGLSPRRPFMAGCRTLMRPSYHAIDRWYVGKLLAWSADLRAAATNRQPGQLNSINLSRPRHWAKESFLEFCAGTLRGTRCPNRVHAVSR